jgi:hypothetical protein
MGITLARQGYYHKKQIKFKPDKKQTGYGEKQTGYGERDIQQFAADNAMIQHQVMLISAQIDQMFETMMVSSDKVSDAEWVVEESAKKGSLIVMIDWNDPKSQDIEVLVSKVARRHEGKRQCPDLSIFDG